MGNCQQSMIVIIIPKICFKLHGTMLLQSKREICCRTENCEDKRLQLIGSALAFSQTNVWIHELSAIQFIDVYAEQKSNLSIILFELSNIIDLFVCDFSHFNSFHFLFFSWRWMDDRLRLYQKRLAVRMSIIVRICVQLNHADN